MRMLVRLVWGLFVLKAVVASPRISRQADLDTYDSANYDVDLDNSNLENQDNYDYEEELTIDDPQVRNCIDRKKMYRQNIQIPWPSHCTKATIVLSTFTLSNIHIPPLI